MFIVNNNSKKDVCLRRSSLPDEAYVQGYTWLKKLQLVNNPWLLRLPEKSYNPKYTLLIQNIQGVPRNMTVGE